MKKPDIDKTKLPEVMEIIEKAASLMEEKDCNNDTEAKQELSVLQKRLEDTTGNKKIDITGFQRYWSYTSLETVASEALMLPPPEEELPDGKILEILLNILSEDNIASEAEMDYWIKYLTVNTRLTNLSDYIFYPDIVGLDADASLEEIANKIIADRNKDS